MKGLRCVAPFIGLSVVGSALAMGGSASVATPRTYANPIDIDYRYNFEQEQEGISYRTGADPAIVRHKGAYYLFQTLADGYWRSDNLVDWTFVTPSRWPVDSVVAPAAWSDDKRLYLMPSLTKPGPIYVSDAPETGQLDYYVRRTPPLPGGVGPGEEVGGLAEGQLPPGPWDPALFRDDDGKWYLYWNSSNVYPIYGIELDPAKRLAYRGTARSLIALHPDVHGWERFGEDHSGATPEGKPVKPFIEGAWMTKVGGRYYLQYGAPGTEYNVYANGTYVADHPLGPFTYAPYNPVAYKPGGFVEGAGHGSTVEDEYGNWWNSGTPWVGDNWAFERRIALFPAHFYDDGQMAVSTRFGDFPHFMPKSHIDDPDSLFTGWMLLSYRKPMTASSTVGAFVAARAADENPRTYWVAASRGRGETLAVDLEGIRTVRAVQVNFADHEAGRFGDAADIYTEFSIEASTDGRTWVRVGDSGPTRRDRTNAYVELAQPVAARFVRYVHGHIGGAHLAISDFRVFGNAPGAPPPRPAVPRVVRNVDRRNALVSWARVPGAIGYNIRWGIRPDRLTLTYQLFADEVAEGGRAARALRSLNVGQEYYIAVEAFNETGVSSLSPTVYMER